MICTVIVRNISICVYIWLIWRFYVYFQDLCQITRLTMDMVLCACDIGCCGVAMAFLVKHGRQVRTVPFRCDTSACMFVDLNLFLAKSWHKMSAPNSNWDPCTWQSLYRLFACSWLLTSEYPNYRLLNLSKCESGGFAEAWCYSNGSELKKLFRHL